MPSGPVRKKGVAADGTPMPKEFEEEVRELAVQNVMKHHKPAPRWNEFAGHEDVNMREDAEKELDAGRGGGGNTLQAAGQSRLVTIPPSITTGNYKTTVKFHKRVPILMKVNTEESYVGVDFKVGRTDVGRNDWITMSCWNVFPINSTAYYVDQNELQWLQRRPFYRYKSATVNLSNFNVHSENLTGETQWAANVTGVACLSTVIDSSKFLPWMVSYNDTGKSYRATSAQVAETMRTNESYKEWPYKLAVLGQRMPATAGATWGSTHKRWIDDTSVMVPHMSKLATMQMDSPAHSGLHIKCSGEWRSNIYGHLQSSYMMSNTTQLYPDMAAGSPKYVQASHSVNVGGGDVTDGLSFPLSHQLIDGQKTPSSGKHECINIQTLLGVGRVSGNCMATDNWYNNDAWPQEPGFKNKIAAFVPKPYSDIGKPYQMNPQGDLLTMRFMVPGKSATYDTYYVHCWMTTELEVEIDENLNDFVYHQRVIPWDVTEKNGVTPMGSVTVASKPAQIPWDKTTIYAIPSITANQLDVVPDTGDNPGGHPLPFGQNSYGANVNIGDQILLNDDKTLEDRGMVRIDDHMEDMTESGPVRPSSARRNVAADAVRRYLD